MSEKNGNTRILLIEDEENLAHGLVYNLRLEGYEATIAVDGRQALECFERGGWSLIILDIMIPFVDGFTVARKIREKDEQVPILMLTAKSTETDRVTGFECGADDYLTKPFHLKEFLLRVGGMIRRGRWYRRLPPKGSQFRFGDGCWVDFHTRTAHGPAGERELTEKETMIMKFFSENQGEVVSRNELLEKVWGYSPDMETRTVDNFVRRLRTYFERDPSRPEHFFSKRGSGYVFKA